MKGSSRRWVLGTIVLLLCAYLGLARPTAAKDENTYRQLQRFSEVLNRIHSDYVEDTDIEELMEAAIRGMLGSLDEHTQYLNAKQYSDLMVGTKGSFGGLGIVISIRDGVLTVIAPIEGTPASRAGIQGGDQILYIEDESTEGFTSDDAVTRLRGPEGTEVSIRIRREGVPELIDHTLTRDIIKLKSVPYKFVTQGGIGYVRLSQFSKTTSQELDESLDSLESLGIRGLVLDLRSNPGGLLDQAVEVSDLFLDNGQLITYTKGRRSNANNRFLDGSDSRHNGYPLIVLVDQHSASASEIVSGAIQDWDRGLVVGKTTFGKGSVQSVIPLDSETGLKLTTAKYYTPSGRCIHRDEDLGGEGGELARAEGSAAETELAKGEIYHTNTGRPVLGGGGITPDIEIDQRKMVSLESKIERRGYFFTFAVEYSPYHEIPADWEVADSTLALFKTFLEEREIEFTEEEWTEGLPYVRNGIKREIFRKAFGDQAAYEVLIGTDEQLQKTFELFGEAETQDQLFALSEQRRAEKLSEEALASEGDGLADSLAVSSGVVRE